MEYPDTPSMTNMVLKRNRLDFSDTPVGDRDEHAKIQLCTELREDGKKSTTKKFIH